MADTNSDDKKQNISNFPFFPGSKTEKVRLN